MQSCSSQDKTVELLYRHLTRGQYNYPNVTSKSFACAMKFLVELLVAQRESDGSDGTNS